MDQEERPKAAEDFDASSPVSSDDSGSEDTPRPDFNESLFEEAAALIDNTRTYAEAELAFQKTRAKLAGRSITVALIAALLAIILIHIAFLALAVGLVIALEPIATIWGAIGLVVGGLVLVVVILVWIAVRRGKKLSSLFGQLEEDGGP